MKEKRQSIGIMKDRKAVILDVPFADENQLVGTTDSIPIYLINSNDKQIWPEYTGLEGQIFICMFSNEIIYAEEIGCNDTLRELVKDIECQIEDLIETDEKVIEQEWRFAKVC